MSTHHQIGAAAEAARRHAAESAQHLAQLTRRLGNIEQKLEHLRLSLDAPDTRMADSQRSFDEASARFVGRLQKDASEGRPVRIDLADTDTLAYFLSGLVAEKLPSLIDLVTAAVNHRAATEDAMASLNAEAASLRQQLKQHGH